MSKEEKPLPKPPQSPFGRKKCFEGVEQEGPLMADKMAAAMAEGRLEEFMKEEMPDNEYARSLASMMMGMTGMMQPGAFPSSSGSGAEEHSAKTEEVKMSEETPSPVQPPEDVINAVQAGDVKGVMEILAREHKKRMPESETIPSGEKKADETPGLSDIEKETLDQIVQIASENKVSVDWMVLRALRLYIREYQKTRRL
jgi:hypothetical protein